MKLTDLHSASGQIPRTSVSQPRHLPPAPSSSSHATFHKVTSSGSTLTRKVPFPSFPITIFPPLPLLPSVALPLRITSCHVSHKQQALTPNNRKANHRNKASKESSS